MRTHSRRGHDILASIPDARIASIATVVLHHHEAIDGSGYPEGLRGEGIPVLARIISIVDSYDAIATVRPYHAPRATWRSCECSMRSKGESTTRTFLRPSARLLSSVHTRLPASTTPRWRARRADVKSRLNTQTGCAVNLDETL
jgi:hypothetical protein